MGLDVTAMGYLPLRPGKSFYCHLDPANYGPECGLAKVVSLLPHCLSLHYTNVRLHYGFRSVQPASCVMDTFPQSNRKMLGSSCTIKLQPIPSL